MPPQQCDRSAAVRGWFQDDSRLAPYRKHRARCGQAFGGEFELEIATWPASRRRAQQLEERFAGARAVTYYCCDPRNLGYGFPVFCDAPSISFTSFCCMSKGKSCARRASGLSSFRETL